MAAMRVPTREQHPGPSAPAQPGSGTKGLSVRLASARRVARIAAASGRQFSYALVQVVSGLPDDEPRAPLARLVASELGRQRGAAPDAVYTFKHALVQE